MGHLEPRRPLSSLDESLVASMAPFSGLDRPKIRELLDQATVRRIIPGETLFEEADAANTFYLLLDGFMRLMRITSGGEQVVVHHVAPGKLFGIAKAVERTAYSVTARAASEGIVLSWPVEAWSQFAHDNPLFEMVMRQTVGERMVEMKDKIVEMATQPVEQRIAMALLRLSQQAGKTTSAGTEIDFPVTRQDLSEMTGTTMHSVSRYMSAWQKAGIVISKRRKVVVAEPSALRGVATGEAT